MPLAAISICSSASARSRSASACSAAAVRARAGSSGRGSSTRSSVNRVRPGVASATAGSMTCAARSEPSSGINVCRASSACRAASAFVGGRSSSTGTRLRRTSASATLPTHARLIPPRPCVVITISPMSTSVAYVASAFAGTPSSSSVRTATPDRSMQPAAVDRRYSSPCSFMACSHSAYSAARPAGFTGSVSGSCTCTRCRRAPLRRA